MDAASFAFSDNIDVSKDGLEFVSILITSVDELTDKIKKMGEELTALQQKLNDLLVENEGAMTQFTEYKGNARTDLMADHATLNEAIKNIIDEVFTNTFVLKNQSEILNAMEGNLFHHIFD